MIRLVTTARPLVVLLGLALLAELVPTTPVARAQGTIKAIKPFFYGTVLIADRWADNGVEVDALVVRAIDDYTICGQGRVGETGPFDLGKDMRGPGAYVVPLNPTPECVSSNARYSLYVNQVHALTTGNPGFAGDGAHARENLHVREVAINNRTRMGAPLGDTSIPLLYFYGTVTDAQGRPRSGMQVRVESADGKCRATTTTDRLNWTPQASPRNPLIIDGFYQVGIQPGKACADRPVTWHFYVGGRRVMSSPVSGRPYGTEVHEALHVQSEP